MIKYELKKLFTNKFVIAMFAVIFTVILAIAIYTYSEYKKGMRVEPILMKKWTVTETAVTKDNIFDFIARYDQIKNDDDNYDYVDTSKRGNSRYLQGSKTTEIEAKINELIKGKQTLTEEEYAEVLHLDSYQINDKLYPEFAALHYMISDFTYKMANFYPEALKETEWEPYDPAEFGFEAEDKTTSIYTQGYNLRDKYMVDNGITYGRNYAWNEITDLGALLIPAVLAVAAAIAAVTMFTGEYNLKTDALIMASRHGRRRLIQNKIIAGGIFSAAVTLYYLLMLLIIFGCFFSLDGGGTTSQIFLSGRVLTYFECFMLMAVIYLIAVFAITVGALAVSACCTKIIPAVLITFLLTIAPFIIPIVVYIGNNNLSILLDSLPINALLLCFNYSHFYEIHFDGVTYVPSQLSLILPMALIQTAVFLPFIHIGWRKHRISN